MKTNKDIPLRLPVLVTRYYVPFPNISTPIKVERSFTKNAVRMANKNYDQYIICVCQRDLVDEKITSERQFFDVGCVCKITQLENTKNGFKCNITGVQRVKISNCVFEDDTIFADGTYYPDNYGNGDEEEVEIKELFSNLGKLIELNAINPSLYNVLQKNKGVYALDVSYILSGNLDDISIETKQSLLECEDVNKRLLILIKETSKLIKKAEIEKLIQDKVRDSNEKNQKEYFLREKLKAIKNELGDDELSNSEEVIKRITEEKYPENIINKVKEEFKKLEMIPQGSLECGLIKSYIDTLISLPWNTSTPDVNDIQSVQKVLDEDHYGLEKPKKRILEYLAVKQMTGNLKAPIICFYGPPGSGKTSLSKSIARSLGRKFVKISLGGVSDEAEIRGFKRTYVGSAPGQIIQGLKKVKVKNPVFLLDEIDKLDKSYHGNPASALLEVLDPEQNVFFTDNWLEEPFDLSNVMFICTANYLENIPAPLLDRLELIELNSYTLFEKVNIAKKYLIEKAINVNGLNKKDVKISDAALKFIIEHYTRESGVRELERLLNSICRKICVSYLKNEIKKKTVTINDVKEYLGVEIFDNNEKNKTAQVGVVTGLAYTQFGGDILPIEVNYFNGTGNFLLTGKLGDVMKESCSIALSYIKSNAKKYNIDPKLFKENDIHIHVPEGAVPKDGPSAGLAMTIAIISSLTNQEVSNNIAMTGEVTLRGNVLPIGGLREKSLAALRSGIKTILIPEKNKANANELPDEVKNNLEIKFVSNVDEAISIIFKG